MRKWHLLSIQLYGNIFSGSFNKCMHVHVKGSPVLFKRENIGV